jgi:hypothetical protein
MAFHGATKPFDRILVYGPEIGGSTMRRTTSIAALALALSGFSAPPSFAQQPPAGQKPARAEVLVLGVFHMANPGRDLFNVQADDMLAPKRQAEIAQVIAALQRAGG